MNTIFWFSGCGLTSRRDGINSTPRPGKISLAPDTTRLNRGWLWTTRFRQNSHKKRWFKLIHKPDSDKLLSCEVSSDVDSIIVLSDLLPLCPTLAIPSIPSRQDTITHSNGLCLDAGPKKARTLISRIPNFNLGSVGRLSVNFLFPDAYDPAFKGIGSSQVEDALLGLFWDHALQPAINSVFSDKAYNSLPQSGQ